MKARPSKSRAKRPTIGLAELSRLSFCNSEQLPKAVEMDGKRLEWVGIGWVVVGSALGDEVLIDTRDRRDTRGDSRSLEGGDATP